MSYFVFTEKLDVYNSDDPTLKDFQKDAFAFIDNLTKVSNAFPLYRIFPTKIYREYLQSLHQINSKGISFHVNHNNNNAILMVRCVVSVCPYNPMTGRQILKEKLDQLKAAMKRGDKDELDAVSGKEFSG